MLDPHTGQEVTQNEPEEVLEEGRKEGRKEVWGGGGLVKRLVKDKADPAEGATEGRRVKSRKRKEQGDADNKRMPRRDFKGDTAGEQTGPFAAHPKKLRGELTTCLRLPGRESMDSNAGQARTVPSDGVEEPPRKRSRIYTRRNKKKQENDINIDEIFNIVNARGPCTSLVISHSECLHNLWAVYRQEFPCGHEFMEFTAQIPNK